MHKKTQILNFLLAKQIISSEQNDILQEKIKQDNFDLNNFLIKEIKIDEEKLTELLAEFHKLAYADISEIEIDEATLNFLPSEIARNYQIICFFKKDSLAKIGLIEPNFKAIEAVNFLAMDEKLRVEYYLVSLSGFKKALKQYQKLEEEVSTALETRAKDEELQLASTDDQNVLEEGMDSAPVSKIVAVIIRHAVEARASDIHIEPYDKESRVRYRVDGILHTSLTLPKNIHNSIIARIKVLAKLKLDETRVPQDGRIRLVVNGREVDFRISTLPLAHSEKVVLRVLDTVKGPPKLVDLGFNKSSLKKIENGIKKTSGILLVTGPTGSGKTTTLYSILTILNQEGVNISTLEDPIEYEMKGINQSQVKPQVGFTFSAGLRSLLRQDPNIIMVGEIRDEETAELSIHASLTGHLVISTLHTNDALGAVFRLMDMNIESFLLASTLRTVIAQRLARCLCPACKKEELISPESAEFMIKELSQLDFKVLQTEIPELKSLEELRQWKIFKTKGCTRCENTGYAGRTSLAEAIEIDEKIEQMIGENDKDLNIDYIKKNQDFISILQDGIIKVLKGITTQEEVLRVIEN